jgi:hypothetical protein
MTKRNSNKRSKARRNAKSKITWWRASLGPLRKGQRLDTSETKTMLNQGAQSTNPKLEQHKELPLHICKLPLSQSILPLNQCSDATRWMQQRAKTCSLCPERLDRVPWVVRPPLYDLTAWGRLDRPKRPTLHQTFQKLPEPLWTPYKCSQVPKSCTNFSLLLTMHESMQNAKSFNI